jgi:hypothetical protein
MHTHLVQNTAFCLCLVTCATPALAIDPTPARGAPGEFGISIGAEYTTGEYGGTTSTDIGYFPLTLHYEAKRWLWWATIPYLIVEGSGDVVILGGGMGGHRQVTTTTTRRTESGIGDIIAAASYRLLAQTQDRPAVDVTGKIYFGTADETTGLGTGENDYAVQLGLTRDMRAWTWSGAGGYLFTGDPAGIAYEDVFYGKLDVARHFDRRTIGVLFEAQQAAIPAGDAPAKLTGYLATRLGTHTRLTGYLLRGFSDASPDWGAGVLFALQY